MWRPVRLWIVVATPALVAWSLSLAARSGASADDRIVMRVGALPGDWLIALGVAVSVLLGLVTVVWQWRDRVAARVLEAQRSQATTDRRRLLQRLDHELKNPLTAMRAAVANLAGQDQDAEAQSAGPLRSLEDQVLRLSRLTGDLRKIADLEMQPVDHAPVDLTELLEEAMEVVSEQPRAAHRRLALHIPSAPWPLPKILGDRDLLALALFNLLDNAIKFTAPGDAIDVRGREDGRWVVIEVADTGVGIPADDLPLVWQELYRGQGSRSVAGSGLGLPLVRTIIERHGGTIDIESRVDQGTAIRVSLPDSRVTDR